jgi:transposase
MPSATSTDLQERIIQWFYDFNLPIDKIVLLSGRSRTTVYQILHLYDTFGQITNPHAMSSRCKRILTPQDLQYIQGILAAKPTMFLDEI